MSTSPASPTNSKWSFKINFNTVLLVFAIFCFGIDLKACIGTALEIQTSDEFPWTYIAYLNFLIISLVATILLIVGIQIKEPALYWPFLVCRCIAVVRLTMSVGVYVLSLVDSPDAYQRPLPPAEPTLNPTILCVWHMIHIAAEIYFGIYAAIRALKSISKQTTSQDSKV